MPFCTLESICKEPWGFVAHRRADIEKASFGGFKKILEEEIQKIFIDIAEAARIIGCSVSTARKHLKACDARYTVQNRVTVYFRDDVAKVSDTYNQPKSGKKQKGANK